MYAELYLQGRLNLDDLIAQEIPLEGINEAYRLQESGAVAHNVRTSFRLKPHGQGIAKLATFI
jgi:S-(hydroxymethyl)glutathione dehydrogenase/alcohol dehydrogenase